MRTKLLENLTKYHKKFKLNNNSFQSINELLSYSKAVSSSVYSFLMNWFDTKEYVEVQTSGSTGKPKSIQLNKEYMLNSAIATGTYFNLPENTKALLCLSTDYIAGKMMLIRALVLGWNLDIVEASSNPLSGISKQYDFCAMVPMQLQNSLKNISFIKKLIVGGGAVPKELQQKISSLNTEIFATYGMTETVTHIAVKKLNKLEDVTLSGVERAFFTILPNINISKDDRGCLIIYAPKISNEQIITNDLVEIISKTEFRWLGRYDTVINSGGIKLIPEQIESKLSEIINSRFFVTGIKDDMLGEKLILIIEEGVTSINSDKNRNYIEKAIDLKSQISNLLTLSKFEIPKEIHFIEKFAETATKKIQRQKTLDLLFKN